MKLGKVSAVWIISLILLTMALIWNVQLWLANAAPCTHAYAVVQNIESLAEQGDVAGLDVDSVFTGFSTKPNQELLSESEMYRHYVLRYQCDEMSVEFYFVSPIETKEFKLHSARQLREVNYHSIDHWWVFDAKMMSDYVRSLE